RCKSGIRNTVRAALAIFTRSDMRHLGVVQEQIGLGAPAAHTKQVARLKELPLWEPMLLNPPTDQRLSLLDARFGTGHQSPPPSSNGPAKLQSRLTKIPQTSAKAAAAVRIIWRLRSCRFCSLRSTALSVVFWRSSVFSRLRPVVPSSTWA